MTSAEITLCFAHNLLTLSEDPRAFEKFYKRTNAKLNRIKNPGRHAKIQRDCRARNPKRDADNRARFSAAHPGYWNDRQRERNQTPEGKAYRREYENNRRATDAAWKIKKSVTTDILQALKRGKGKKHARTSQLLDCSIPEFISHIEKQWKPGMTWENHGSVWHLDHKRPKRSFDLTNPSQQAACFHWSNWQPLPAFENQSKGAKWAGIDWRRK